MKTVFDKITREELINRINKLSEKNTSRWGKMNIYQMVKHCATWEEWIVGKNKPSYKQEFIGKIFGKIALKRMIKNENPLDRNVPTSKQFKSIEKEGDIQAQQQKWIALIREYENYSNPGFIHDFFGRMTKEQIGVLAYKHSDHHLRQFGA
jgi:hypothetical protein